MAAVPDEVINENQGDVVIAEEDNLVIVLTASGELVYRLASQPYGRQVFPEMRSAPAPVANLDAAAESKLGGEQKAVSVVPRTKIKDLPESLRDYLINVGFNPETSINTIKPFDIGDRQIMILLPYELLLQRNELMLLSILLDSPDIYVNSRSQQPDALDSFIRYVTQQQTSGVPLSSESDAHEVFAKLMQIYKKNNLSLDQAKLQVPLDEIEDTKDIITILIRAQILQDKYYFDLLFEAKASHRVCEGANTILHTLILSHPPEGMITQLLKLMVLGVDITACDQQKNTALHLCVREFAKNPKRLEFLTVAKILLIVGIDRNAKNKMQRTASDYVKPNTHFHHPLMYQILSTPLDELRTIPFLEALAEPLFKGSYLKEGLLDVAVRRINEERANPETAAAAATTGFRSTSFCAAIPTQAMPSSAVASSSAAAGGEAHSNQHFPSPLLVRNLFMDVIQVQINRFVFSLKIKEQLELLSKSPIELIQDFGGFYLPFVAKTEAALDLITRAFQKAVEDKEGSKMRMALQRAAPLLYSEAATSASSSSISSATAEATTSASSSSTSNAVTNTASALVITEVLTKCTKT